MSSATLSIPDLENEVTSRRAPTSIYSKITRAASEIGTVHKTGKFSGQGTYTYLSDKDITEAVNEAIAKVGLAFIPAGFRIISDEQVTERMRRVVLSGNFIIADNTTGDVVEIKDVPGEAIDNFDKAVSKCLTYCRRDAMRLAFNIAGDDASSEAAKNYQSSSPQQRYQAPPQAKVQAPPPPKAQQDAQPKINIEQPTAQAHPEIKDAFEDDPVTHDSGLEPWGTTQPVSFLDLMAYVSAALSAVGWIDKAERNAYIRKHLSAYKDTPGAIDAAKKFFRQINSGDHVSPGRDPVPGELS